MPGFGGDRVSRLALGCPASLAGAATRAGMVPVPPRGPLSRGPAPAQLVSQTIESRRTRSSSISSTRRLMVRVTSFFRSRP